MGKSKLIFCRKQKSIELHRIVVTDLVYPCEIILLHFFQCESLLKPPEKGANFWCSHLKSSSLNPQAANHFSLTFIHSHNSHTQMLKTWDLLSSTHTLCAHTQANQCQEGVATPATGQWQLDRLGLFSQQVMRSSLSMLEQMQVPGALVSFPLMVRSSSPCDVAFFSWVCHVHLAHTGLWYQVAAVGTPPPHNLQGATGRLNKCLFPMWCLWTAVYQRKKRRSAKSCQHIFFTSVNKRSKKFPCSSHLLHLVVL